jgi:plasmid stability protein
MKLPTNELLLALRSPTSGWLATMVCALEEAVRDPDFSEHHRALLTQLLAAESIPAPVAAAAEERLCRFEQCVAETQADLVTAITQPSQPARPKLTLVGSAAA